MEHKHKINHPHAVNLKQMLVHVMKHKYIFGLAAALIYGALVSGLIFWAIQPTSSFTSLIRLAKNKEVVSPITNGASPKSVTAASKATFIAITSDVRVMQQGKWFKAEASTEISQGDSVYTGEKSQAAIMFSDGSLLRLSENSYITLNHYAVSETQTQVDLYQLVGKSWNRVQHLAGKETQYQVETNTAVATVRGTAFGVEADSINSDITVEEGTVSASLVDRTQSVPVTMFETQVAKNQLAAFSKNQLSQMQAAKAENKLFDTTPMQPKAVAKMPVWISENIQADMKVMPIIEKYKDQPVPLKPEIILELRNETKSDMTPSNPSPSISPTILKTNLQTVAPAPLQIAPTPTPLLLPINNNNATIDNIAPVQLAPTASPAVILSPTRAVLPVFIATPTPTPLLNIIPFNNNVKIK